MRWLRILFKSSAWPGWALLILSQLDRIDRAISRISNIDFVRQNAPFIKKMAGKLRPYLSDGLVQIVLIVVGLVWIGLTTKRQTRPSAGEPEETQEPEEGAAACLEVKPWVVQGTEPQPTSFFHLGLCWELEPAFFTDDYKKITNPSTNTLQDLVLGPFCSSCKTVLRREVKRNWMSAEVGRVYRVAESCSCGQQVPKQPGLTLDDVLNDVWRTAQAHVRAKRPIPAGPCG